LSAEALAKVEAWAKVGPAINHDQLRLMTRYLIKHVGNMGDAVFFIPPILAGLKQQDPKCHITFVTAWGYKDARGHWGRRGMGGYSIHLFMTNPNIDQLIHWHSTKSSLDSKICIEDGQSFPTWSADHYVRQKKTGAFDRVIELDIGIGIDDNPMIKLFKIAGLPPTTPTNYQIYLTDSDREVAKILMTDRKHPRIALLEGLAGESTRGWDPNKIDQLVSAIMATYGVNPFWFGAKHVMYVEGRPATLRENIATLELTDVGIGVLSGPLHFAAGIGLPTISLYCDQPIHRAAPAFFLNPTIKFAAAKHRTILGPSHQPYQFLKYDQRIPSLTDIEEAAQQFKFWTHPGRQSTKSCLSVITVDEIMTVLQDVISKQTPHHVNI